jgi:hypothetical protein
MLFTNQWRHHFIRQSKVIRGENNSTLAGRSIKLNCWRWLTFMGTPQLIFSLMSHVIYLDGIRRLW